MGNWKEEANKLYFVEHLKITEIADKLQKTRKTISEYLQSQQGFKEEKERRKAENADKRPEYKRTWERKNRQSTSEVEVALLKRQHNIDVAVLSYERVYSQS